METTITATELARNLSDVLNRVRYRGERFRIVRGSEVIASIQPDSAPGQFTPQDLVDLLRRLPAPDPDFENDLKEIRAAQGRLPPSPWES